MAGKRIRFCGAINGSIVQRPGETEEDAVERAQGILLDLLDGAKRLGNGDGHGPNVGLEVDS